LAISSPNEFLVIIVTAFIDLVYCTILFFCLCFSCHHGGEINITAMEYKQLKEKEGDYSD